MVGVGRMGDTGVDDADSEGIAELLVTKLVKESFANAVMRGG